MSKLKKGSQPTYPYIIIPTMIRSNLGVFVHEESTMNIDDIKLISLKSLGFMSTADFMNCYPSNLRTGSNLVNNIPSSRGVKFKDVAMFDDMFYSLNAVSKRDSSKMRESLSYILSKAVETDRTSVFVVTPTIEQLKKVESYNDCNLNEFWFCNDWRES